MDNTHDGENHDDAWWWDASVTSAELASEIDELREALEQLKKGNQ